MNMSLPFQANYSFVDRFVLYLASMMVSGALAYSYGFHFVMDERLVDCAAKPKPWMRTQFQAPVEAKTA